MTKALEGIGKIFIIDGPQYDSSWEKIIERAKLNKIINKYSCKGILIELIDLRDEEWECRGEVILKRKKLKGDPYGNSVIQLNENSEFIGHNGQGRYYGSDYNTKETNYHHFGRRHEYRLSATALNADFFINIPKLKTHKKVGVTLSLKNLVGINTGRNWLPHYTDGDPSIGGDQFPVQKYKNVLERFGVRTFQRLAFRYPKIIPQIFKTTKQITKQFFGNTDKIIRSGNWYGNDTIWRMVLDINKCLFHFHKGESNNLKFGRYLSIIDGIVAGEGNGPASPDPISTGLLIAGFNPVAVDCVATKLMGFEYEKIPMLKNAFDIRHLPLVDFSYKDIKIISNLREYTGKITLIDKKCLFHFKPTLGWIGHIELA